MMDYGSAANGEHRPPVLIFADSVRRAAIAAAAVEAAGGRAVAGGGSAGALARLEQQAQVAAVMLEVEPQQDETALEPLLARLGSDTAQGRYTAVVTVPVPLIDIAAARLGEGAAYLLSEPDPLQRQVAVGLALAKAQAGVRDVDLHITTHRLQELSEETARVSRALAALSRELPSEPAPPPGVGVPVTAPAIRAILRARRARDRFFPADLFADPAWDMLLDLMAARLERQPVSVSSLCIAAAVPPTTALRWIKALTEQGLFRRVADQHDGRRVHIELSDPAAAAVQAYLSAHLPSAS